MAGSVSNGSGKSLARWLRENGFDDDAVARMSRRCRNLHSLDAGEAPGVWDYLLTGVKMERRKLRHVVAKCRSWDTELIGAGDGRHAARCWRQEEIQGELADETGRSSA